MRDALMRHVPEPSAEFSLTCEMSMLFRMLATAASGTVCQVGKHELAAHWADVWVCGGGAGTVICPLRLGNLSRCACQVPRHGPLGKCVVPHSLCLHGVDGPESSSHDLPASPDPPAPRRPPTCCVRYARTRRQQGWACWRASRASAPPQTLRWAAARPAGSLHPS